MENMLIQGLAAVGTAAIILAVKGSIKQLCLRYLAQNGCSCQYR